MVTTTMSVFNLYTNHQLAKPLTVYPATNSKAKI